MISLTKETKIKIFLLLKNIPKRLKIIKCDLLICLVLLLSLVWGISMIVRNVSIFSCGLI